MGEEFMIPETSVNWKAFEYKYSDNLQRAFENLTYYLFCHEFHQKNGIFRYFNQPHIETNPIQVGDKLIGFQSKYYADSVAMSGKKEELIKAVEGAARSYPGITYFVLENQDTFRDILQVFIKAGWKLVLTIRTVYKASFYNCLLKNVKVQQYHTEPISNSKLLELSGTYGFVLPSDKKFKEFLCTPFYLNLYLALENVEDEEKNALNREVFEEKIWEDIIRNNRKRKNNMPARREEVLLYITMEMLMNDNYMYEIQVMTIRPLLNWSRLEY